jgi:hypothetical protein
MPQLVPEMILERCNETKHHESGCLLGVVSCQSWPIWMVGCFPALVAPELPAETRPTHLRRRARRRLTLLPANRGER